VSALALASALGALVGASPPPALDLSPADGARRARAVRARFGHGPEAPLGPGPRTLPTPRFLWVEDRSRSLPGPPWTTDDAYAEAFELARGAWASREPDRARLLIVFTTFEEGGRALFYTALANDVRGLGAGEEAALFDASPGSQLEGYVWMGALSVLDAAGPAFATEAFLHEIAHRWAAYVRVDLPGVPEDALLGRHRSHWSFLLHTGNSPMEGNAWRMGEGERWSTHFEEPRRFAFSPLDLYLMGLVPPREVPPFPVLLEVDRIQPSWFSARPEEAPAHRLGMTVSVRARETAWIDIDDVIAHAGPRVPAASPGLPVRFPIGVVLLSDGRARATQARLADFDRRLRGWIDAFEAATGGRMRLEAGLESAGRGALGAACAGPEDCDRTVADRCAAPTAGAPVVCTRACSTHGACGPGACCVGARAPGLCLPEPTGGGCGPEPAWGRDAGSSGGERPRRRAPQAPREPARDGCRCTGLRGRGLGPLGLLLALRPWPRRRQT
jgi:hypothetical protein